MGPHPIYSLLLDRTYIFLYLFRRFNSFDLLFFFFKSIEELAIAMVGQVAHVEWPYLVEAKIDSIATDTVKYFFDKNTQLLKSQLVEHEIYNNVKREMRSASSYLMKKKGIDVGDCGLLVEARLMMGKRFV